MYIPDSAIIPLFVASFIMLTVQYYRVDPERRLLNLRFGLMFFAVVLIFTKILVGGNMLSMVLFALGLFWLGLSIYLLRTMPPPRH